MINTAKYNINVETLYKKLLPWFYKINSENNLLKPSTNDLLDVVSGSLSTMQQQLYAIMEAQRQLLNYNGQHIVLVKMLNDKFDPLLRGFSITENDLTVNIAETWYLESESDPENKVWYLQGESDPSPKIMYLQSEILGGQYNFTVNTPVAVPNSDEEIISEIIKYSKTGKTFNINRI